MYLYLHVKCLHSRHGEKIIYTIKCIDTGHATKT